MSAPGSRGRRVVPTGPTVGSLISWAVRALTGWTDSPLLDAQVLLAFEISRPRSSLLAFPERSVGVAFAERFERAVVRRANGEPIAYLVRSQEFFSLSLRVSPAVLIPRPETELLVEEVLTLWPKGEARSVLDLATGSGAIALALKHERPELTITASDVSAAALTIARSNAERLGIGVRFVESSWFAQLAGERFDAIVSNPPYLESDDRAFAALASEPRLALDGGADGLDAYRAVLGAARAHLKDDGVLLLEHGHDQRERLVQLAGELGWQVAAVRADLAGHARVLALRA